MCPTCVPHKHQLINSSSFRSGAGAGAAKLRDHTEIQSKEPLLPPTTTILLPSANDVFTAVGGPPAFLDPESNRQLIIPITTAQQQQQPNSSVVEKTGKRKGGGAWDISHMAPKLHSDEEAAQAGQIIGKAKRYKNGEAEEEEINVVVEKPRPASSSKKATVSMGLEEFTEKGGAAQLPRKRQDRKEKEKEKRGLGQSSNTHWKSDAEMALRQQYD